MRRAVFSVCPSFASARRSCSSSYRVTTMALVRSDAPCIGPAEPKLERRTSESSLRKGGNASLSVIAACISCERQSASIRRCPAAASRASRTNLSGATSTGRAMAILVAPQVTAARALRFPFRPFFENPMTWHDEDQEDRRVTRQGCPDAGCKVSASPRRLTPEETRRVDARPLDGLGLGHHHRLRRSAPRRPASRHRDTRATDFSPNGNTTRGHTRSPHAVRLGPRRCQHHSTHVHFRIREQYCQAPSVRVGHHSKPPAPSSAAPSSSIPSSIG